MLVLMLASSISLFLYAEHRHCFRPFFLLAIPSLVETAFQQLISLTPSIEYDRVLVLWEMISKITMNRVHTSTYFEL